MQIYRASHGCYTFKIPQAFQKAIKYRNSQEIRGQGSGTRLFKQLSSDTAGYSKSIFDLYFWQNNIPDFRVSYYCDRTITTKSVHLEAEYP